MASIKRQYVAVLPDGTEYFGEAYNGHSVCEDAVRRLNLTTPRANPQKVSVKLFELVIMDGNLKRLARATQEVLPSLERMTEEEYNSELREILKPLPVEFHAFITHQAYEQGHSAGYEEVIGIARDLANDLLPCINDYRGGV